MRMSGWQSVAGLMAVDALFTTGCTLLIDHDANKGLGPPGCFSDTPGTLGEFLNQCGRAETDSTFDNCARLSPLCSAGAPSLIDPPIPAPSIPKSPGPTPPELCLDPVKRPQVVFLNGSSNFIPLLVRLAHLLDTPPDGLPKIIPVFQQTNSCAGIRSIYGPDKPLMKDPPLAGPGFYASYYPTDGSDPQQCSLGPDGVPADIGESEIFASSCDGLVKPGGKDQGGAQGVATSLAVVAQANQESAIGIVGTDFYEKDDKNLKALAFQASGQLAAYWPDSTPKTRDKRNVRDGHYPIWGPLHFFTVASPTPAVQSFLSAVSETSLEKEVLDAYVQSSFVPDCAMMVSRISEDQEINGYRRPRTCNCYFEASVPGGTLPPGCKACSMDTDCPRAQTCNVGYCE